MAHDRSRHSAHMAPTPRGGRHAGGEKPQASRTPRDARSAAAARGAGAGAGRQAALGASRPLADVRPSRSERPVRLASESDHIATIGAGQGARVTTRHNASQAADQARRNAECRYAERHPEARAAASGPRRSRLNVVLLVVAAVLVLAVVFALGTLVNSVLFPPAQETGTATDQTLRLTESEQQLQQEQDAHDAGQEQVGVDGSVSYDGQAYALRQADDGTWELAFAEGGEAICRLEGTPVALLRTGSTLLVPENVDGGWDVACYVIGGHTDLTYVMGADGEKAGGSGAVASCELDGTTLRVTDDTGATTDVALE
ncbi:hypothetical protein [Thermophilibacter sp.]